MADINYEYALNLDENERKWTERTENLREVIRFFAKNTILQFTSMDVQMRAFDLLQFINKGERSEFFKSEVDGYLQYFDEFKSEYEKSGTSEQLAKISKIITENKL